MLFESRINGSVDGIVVAQMEVVTRDNCPALHGRGIFQIAYFFDDQLFMADHVLEKGFAEKVRDTGHELI